MAVTYETMNQNEYRALSLSIRDQDDNDFIPTTVYTTIYNDSNIVIVEETNAMITDNEITTLITQDVSKNYGNYYVIWKIIKKIDLIDYIYYHKTILHILEL